MTETTTHRQKWVAMLAKLVCPTDATGAAKSMAAMLPMLADFPDAAFTLPCLDFVATKVRRTPCYAELREGLAEWWRDNRPPHSAIADDSLAELDGAERWWARKWQQLRDAHFPTIEGRPDIQQARDHYASLMQRHAPKAWSMVEDGRL